MMIDDITLNFSSSSNEKNDHQIDHNPNYLQLLDAFVTRYKKNSKFKIKAIDIFHRYK